MVIGASARAATPRRSCTRCWVRSESSKVNCNSGQFRFRALCGASVVASSCNCMGATAMVCERGKTTRRKQQQRRRSSEESNPNSSSSSDDDALRDEVQKRKKTNGTHAHQPYGPVSNPWSLTRLRHARLSRRPLSDRMVLSVRRRIHCGIGRFWRCFLAKICLTLKVLFDGWTRRHAGTQASRAGVAQQQQQQQWSQHSSSREVGRGRAANWERSAGRIQFG